jgi:hypothetical protein
MALDMPLLSLGNYIPTQAVSDQGMVFYPRAGPKLSSPAFRPVPIVQDVHILVAVQQEMH